MRELLVIFALALAAPLAIDGHGLFDYNPTSCINSELTDAGYGVTEGSSEDQIRLALISLQKKRKNSKIPEDCLYVMSRAVGASNDLCADTYYIRSVRKTDTQKIRSKIMGDYMRNLIEKQNELCEKMVQEKFDEFWDKLGAKAQEQIDKFANPLLGYSIGTPTAEYIFESLRSMGYEKDQVFTDEIYEKHLEAMINAVRSHKKELAAAIKRQGDLSGVVEARPIVKRLGVANLALQLIEGSGLATSRFFWHANYFRMLTKYAELDRSVNYESIPKEALVNKVYSGIQACVRNEIKEYPNSSTKDGRKAECYSQLFGGCEANSDVLAGAQFFRRHGSRMHPKEKFYVLNLATVCSIRHELSWDEVERREAEREPGMIEHLLEKLRVK